MGADKPKITLPSFGKAAEKSVPKIKTAPTSPPTKTIVVEDLPGVLPPVGLFDPLDFAGKADDNTIRKYREAELTHGRIAMVASIGFFVGEAIGGIAPIFEGVKGAGITQIGQVPAVFW